MSRKKSSRGNWWAFPKELLMPEFDDLLYCFVDEEYETGSEVFQRINSVDERADAKKRVRNSSQVLERR